MYPVRVLSLETVSDRGNEYGLDCGWAEFVGKKPACSDRGFGVGFCVEVTFRRY
jgi:hypothetical protein